MGMGRPTRYSPELAARICRGVADGKKLVDICAEEKPQLSASVVYEWLLKHKDFSELYARAREERAEFFADEVVAIADSEEDPNKARVRIDARKWAAAKLNPRRYADKSLHGGDPDNPIKHEHKVNRIELVAPALSKRHDDSADTATA